MKVANFLLVGLALIVLVLNAVLLQQNADLKRRLKSLSEEHYREVALLPNTLLPPLHGFSADGEVMTIEYGGDFGKTMLLVFSTNCAVCDENWPAWNRILAASEGRSVRAVTVSLSGVPRDAYSNRFGLRRLEVLVHPNEQDREAYKLTHTPQTILIDLLGSVEGVWTGKLSGADEQEIKDRLSGGPTESGFRSSGRGVN